jgi:trans-aconitate methyltransferase
MRNPEESSNMPHPGGDQQFWQDEIVRNYEYQQYIASEKKDESLASTVRIINYFSYMNSIHAPVILDLGCGPGTETTLSRYLLEGVPNSSVIGIDSSSQMVEVANSRLIPEYGNRFFGFVGDFNNDRFWVPDIDRRYDFITSFAALHYLSDRRMYIFLREIYDHLEDNGVFIAGMGNRSASPRIAEMEEVFRVEYTYSQLDSDRRPASFQEFRRTFKETDSRANINWHSYREWLELIEDAGFREVDVVWHLWIRSIFVALK